MVLIIHVQDIHTCGTRVRIISTDEDMGRNIAFPTILRVCPA